MTDNYIIELFLNKEDPHVVHAGTATVKKGLFCQVAVVLQR